MTHFHWDNSFAVDAPELNQEHQIIIGIMNKLHREYLNGQINRARDSLQQLYDYAQLHFCNEEAYMQARQFHDMDKHRKVHQALLDKLQRFISQFDSKKTLPEAFFTFLNAWVQTHMGQMDLEYSRTG